MQLDKFEEFPSLSEINSLDDTKKSKSSKNNHNNANESSKREVGTQKKEQAEEVNSEFGMIGLINEIRQQKSGTPSMSRFYAPLSHSNYSIFVPGIELNTLGIDLEIQDHMFTSFISPFSTAPEDPPLDSFLPIEYTLNTQQKEAMANVKIDGLSNQTLLFLFYTRPNDYLQLVTSTVLHKRSWHYFKPSQLWFKKINDDRIEVFDVDKWKSLECDISIIDWSKVETEPPLNFSQVENLWLGSQNQLLQKRTRTAKYPQTQSSNGLDTQSGLEHPG